MSADSSRRPREGRHRHGENGPRDSHGPRHRHEPHGLHSGRKFSSEDLQLLLLALLEKSPSHGYELIKSLESLSDGYYVPSPGMVYPSLTYLEEIGYAKVETEGAKKRYHLTGEGLGQLTENRARAERTLQELAQIGARMEDARRAFAGERDLGESLEGQSEELRSVRHDLKTFLRGYAPASREEDGRVAGILRRALTSVRNEPGTGQGHDVDALLRLIKDRRSMGLSRLSSEPVARAFIERMLEAANWAPSNDDTEPWRFTVFAGEGRETLAELFEAAQMEDVANGKAIHGKEADGAHKRAFAAPVWISIGMAPGLKEDGTLLMSEDEEIMAVACAVQNLHLTAQAQGLAGMWHSKGVSVHPAVASGLGLKPPARLLGFFMCGWPAGEWLTASRRPLSEKATWIGTLSEEEK